MFFIVKLISRLPLRLLYVIAWFFSFPLRVFYRRKLVSSNLRRIFPEKSEKEIAKITNQFYRNFADVVVEILKASTISEKEINRRVKYLNPEISFEEQKKGKSLLIFTTHQCNWEWLALASGGQLSVPGDPIYKPLQNPEADKFMYDLRAKFGGVPLSKDKAGRELLRSRDQHRIIGIVADQSPPREHVHWAHLFGIESDFYPGLVQLPYLMQATAVFARGVRKKRGFYELELIKIGEPPYEKNDFTVLQNYIKELEKSIKDHPADYLWTHNRWKHTRDQNEEIINFSSN